MLYKVVKEEGVEVDGTEFAKDEILDLEADAFNIPALLEEGAIVETTEEEEEEDEEEEEEEEEGQGTHQTEPALSFNGKKIVGEVSDVETEGVLYKTFAVEGGETFKVPVKEFEEQVVRE